MKRFVAEWMSKLALNPETGDVERDRCEHSYKSFGIRGTTGNREKTALLRAGRYACVNDCYGSEGFVNVEEWTRDLYSDGSMVKGWKRIERWLFQEGKLVERVDCD